MFMQQDWLMRQIEMVAAVIAKLIFGKDARPAEWQQALAQQQADDLEGRLTGLLDRGRLGEAEDLLFQQMEEMDGAESVLAAAVGFYRRANALTDDELAAQGFTRTELWEGLKEATARCGLSIPELWGE